MTICNNESKANALAPKHYNAELGRAIKGLVVCLDVTACDIPMDV